MALSFLLLFFLSFFHSFYSPFLKQLLETGSVFVVMCVTVTVHSQLGALEKANHNHCTSKEDPSGIYALLKTRTGNKNFPIRVTKQM
jgi:hypothetical protein